MQGELDVLRKAAGRRPMQKQLFKRNKFCLAETTSLLKWLSH